MKIPIDIGMEFQTMMAHLTFPIRKEGKNILYHPETLSMVTLFEPTPKKNKKITMYGDSMSVKSDYYQLMKMNKDWVEKGNHTLRFTLSNGSKEDIVLNKPFRDIMNDVEFVVTYFDKVEVDFTKDGVLSFIFAQVKKAGEEIQNQIKKLSVQEILHTSVVGGRGRPATSCSPFHRLHYSENKFCLMSKAPLVTTPFPYYIQATLGIPLRYVWQVMLILNDAYLATPNPVPEQILEMDIMKDINGVGGTTSLVDILYKLFMYSFRTRKNRKASPYAIRVQFRQLLKLMTPEQYDFFRQRVRQLQPRLSQDNDDVKEQAVIYADTLYRQEFKSNDETNKPQFLKNNLFQHNGIITVLPTVLVHDKPLDTMVYFECRYLQAILLHHCRKNTNGLLTVSDLRTLGV